MRNLWPWNVTALASGCLDPCFGRIAPIQRRRAPGDRRDSARLLSDSDPLKRDSAPCPPVWWPGQAGDTVPPGEDTLRSDLRESGGEMPRVPRISTCLARLRRVFHLKSGALRMAVRSWEEVGALGRTEEGPGSPAVRRCGNAWGTSWFEVYTRERHRLPDGRGSVGFREPPKACRIWTKYIGRVSTT